MAMPDSAVRTPEETTSDELVILVVRTAKALVERLRSERPPGSPPPMPVMHGLAARYLRGRDDVTAVELARYLRITKQSTSEVVALLEQAGIVRRAPHPRDGRARVVLLTDEGAARLDEGRARWQRIEDEWADLVGRENLDGMRQALNAYLEADDTRGADGRECA